jgi:hypothetical protein
LRIAPRVFVRPGELCHAEWRAFDLTEAGGEGHPLCVSAMDAGFRAMGFAGDGECGACRIN